MLSKIKNIASYHRYVIKTNFYLSKWNFLVLTILSLVSLLCAFLVVYFSVPFLDFILGKNTNNYHEITETLIKFLNYINLEISFFICAAFFLITIIFKSLVDTAFEYYAVKMQYKYMINAGFELNKKILNMYQSFFIKFSTSKILNLYSKETERAAGVILSFFMILNSFLQIIIFLAVPAYLNFSFTISFLMMLILFLAPLTYLNLISIKIGIKSTKVNDEYFRTLTNNFLYSKFISIHGLLSKADQLFKKSFNSYRENKLQSNLVGLIIRNYIQPIGIFCLVFTFSFFYDEFDNLPVIGAIVWSLTRILAPVNNLLSNFNLINIQIGAFKNIYETLNNFKNLKINNGDTDIEKINEISLNKVNFNYDKKEILKDIDLNIKKGSKIAIIGETGSGKSTLLDIISNVNKPDSGNVKINKIEYEKINFYKLRKKISYVPQMLSILDGTIKEYFEFYNENIDELKINEHLSFLDCDKFLRNDSDRLNEYLGDKGMKLSGGQKQKIILAAAISRKPELIILDESTNAIDYDEEKKVLDKLCNLESTIIFISHKLQNFQNKFDKIYKIENKKLINIV
tara:strand:+ start:1105 stop:2820 length:1716 start_codon:yes stop_codon:yes gene_type:complete